MANLSKLLSSRVDYLILIAASALALIGVSTIQSTVVAANSSEILSETLINTQVLSISAGIVVMIVLMFVNYRYLLYTAVPIYLMVIGLLVGLYFLGVNVRGVTRWYDLGLFLLQPSTIGAVLLVISFAGFFSFVGEKINRLPYLLALIFSFIPPTLLIFLQPDLGSALVVVLVWIGLLHLAPIKISRLLVLYALALILMPLAWHGLADYQKARFLTFVTPTEDPLGSGYNTLQSMIAVGSGQIFGRGWGRGTQSHLQFLPEQHTDFIFATYAEEQGFVGTAVVILLYGVIVWRGIRIIRTTNDLFGQLIAGGVIIWLASHVLINIGMNIGLAPVTGIPLPFLSYGGTGSITAFLAIGLLESVAISRLD